MVDCTETQVNAVPAMNIKHQKLLEALLSDSLACVNPPFCLCAKLLSYFLYQVFDNFIFLDAFGLNLISSNPPNAKNLT
jgi:hypothetical protein